ncbi:MAG TPA: hypothetical protein VMZ53_30975 [Kofleriaceae bacterium]|nr:hypothetical protein [Kofleriaceae bacterium]
MTTKPENSTDATRGSTLRARVEARMRELELALSTLSPTDRARPDIEIALNGVRGLLTGDLDHIPYVVAAELSNWLEANKHVNERHAASDAASDAEDVATEPDAAVDKP